MDNQQGTVTEGELGWLAGIIEGEGSITMNVRKKSWKGWNGVGVDLTVCVANTDAGIIEKANDIFAKLSSSSPRIVETVKSPIYKKDGSTYVNVLKNVMQVHVNKMNDIVLVLKAILPYMAGEKVARARLAIQFIERRMARKTGDAAQQAAQYDRYDWETVAEFYKLKNRPIPPEVIGLLNEHEQNQLKAG
jgi:hypothetical protein